MDPDENLRQQLRLAKKLLDAWDNETRIDRDVAIRLAERVEALDEWLSKGGFLPKRWDHDR
jgi:hypothetical protein